MIGKPLSGIIVPIVTPFHADESFNPHALYMLVDFLIDSGVQGIFPVGSVGEFYALDTAEIQQVIATVVEAAHGRVPVIAGTGAIDTRRTIALSQFAEAIGADAVTILTPYYIQPTEAELYRHYADVLNAVSLPVLGYSNPGRSGGISLTPALVGRLAADFPHFVGIKDSSGSISLLKEYIRATPPEFMTFTGLDSMIFEAVISGASGAVVGIANFAPQRAVAIYERARADDIVAARDLQASYETLRATYSLGTFPAVTKAAARMVGLPVGPTRRPIGDLAPEAEARLRAVLIDVLGSDALRS